VKFGLKSLNFGQIDLIADDKFEGCFVRCREEGEGVRLEAETFLDAGIGEFRGNVELGDPVSEIRIRKLGAVGFDLDEGKPGEEGEEVDEIGLLKKWFSPTDDESRAIVLEDCFRQIFGGKFKKLICFGEFLSVLMFPGRVFPIPGVGSIAPMTV
jgi:hypothetical protein